MSRPDVFAALHAPLVQGYALDALEAGVAVADVPSRAGAEAFLEKVLAARISEHDGIGLGRGVRFAEGNVAGIGLVSGDELVQLTAFPENGPEAPAGQQPHVRIRRPSRRRGA